MIRLLERYLVEVVERHDFCPWARTARVRGEVGIEVLWGTPTLEQWVTTANELLARPKVQVAMVVAPELAMGRKAMHALRNEVSAGVPQAGVAEFHPDAPLDLETPSRTVPFTRRSPDPLMQLVPLSVLATVRTNQGKVMIDPQALLLGQIPMPKRDTADRIAELNHARVKAQHASIVATLDDIAADRARSYAAVGIQI